MPLSRDHTHTIATRALPPTVDAPALIDEALDIAQQYIQGFLSFSPTITVGVFYFLSQTYMLPPEEYSITTKFTTTLAELCEYVMNLRDKNMYFPAATTLAYIEFTKWEQTHKKATAQNVLDQLLHLTNMIDVRSNEIKQYAFIYKYIFQHIAADATVYNAFFADKSLPYCAVEQVCNFIPMERSSAAKFLTQTQHSPVEQDDVFTELVSFNDGRNASQNNTGPIAYLPSTPSVLAGRSNNSGQSFAESHNNTLNTSGTGSNNNSNNNKDNNLNINININNMSTAGQKHHPVTPTTANSNNNINNNNNNNNTKSTAYNKNLSDNTYLPTPVVTGKSHAFRNNNTEDNYLHNNEQCDGDMVITPELVEQLMYTRSYIVGLGKYGVADPSLLETSPIATRNVYASPIKTPTGHSQPNSPQHQQQQLTAEEEEELRELEEQRQFLPLYPYIRYSELREALLKRRENNDARLQEIEEERAKVLNNGWYTDLALLGVGVAAATCIMLQNQFQYFYTPAKEKKAKFQPSQHITKYE